MKTKPASDRSFYLLSSCEYGTEVLDFTVLEEGIVSVARFWADNNGVRNVKEATLDLTRARRIYRYFVRQGFVPVI